MEYPKSHQKTYSTRILDPNDTFSHNLTSGKCIKVVWMIVKKSVDWYHKSLKGKMEILRKDLMSSYSLYTKVWSDRSNRGKRSKRLIILIKIQKGMCYLKRTVKSCSRKRASILIFLASDRDPFHSPKFFFIKFGGRTAASKIVLLSVFLPVE